MPRLGGVSCAEILHYTIFGQLLFESHVISRHRVISKFWEEMFGREGSAIGLVGNA